MLNKEEFQSIIQKYLSGESSPEEERLIERWYANITGSEHRLERHEQIALEERIRSKLLRRQGRVAEKRPVPLRAFGGRYSFLPELAIACCIVVLVTVAVHYFRMPPPARNEATAAVTTRRIENRDAEVKAFRLSDGSIVNLGPGAVLEIGEFATAKREVFLQKGQGFFNVTRDETRPFLVYTNEIVIRVLGTSFLIQTGEKDVTVSVK